MVEYEHKISYCIDRCIFIKEHKNENIWECSLYDSIIKNKMKCTECILKEEEAEQNKYLNYLLETILSKK